jgi:hypothetical protein
VSLEQGHEAFQRADEAILDGRRKHPEMDALYQEATKKTATRRLF